MAVSEAARTEGRGGKNHSGRPEWPGLLPSNLEGSSSNPHKSIVGVFPSSINLSEDSLLPYP
ncbi:hypothetical protein CUMW_141010 [Citrus unshiu]|nr:hypothetical protein CUMW_141010 [Citrus unshiu]